MKVQYNGKQAGTIMKPADSKQIHVLADGCKVILNFPAKPEGPVINDIKRMLLGGAVKM